MKALKALVCIVLPLFAACVDFEEEKNNMDGVDSGAYLTAVKITDAKGNDVATDIVIPPLVLGSDKQEQLKDPSNTVILVTVKSGTDVTSLKLVGTLSANSSAASINPKMGVLTDFSNPYTYTVTSYNKKNVVAYSVRIVRGQ